MKNTLIALFKYYIKKEPVWSSTFIDEKSITMGYGHLDTLGLFEYPMPQWFIKRYWGAYTWHESRLYKK